MSFGIRGVLESFGARSEDMAIRARVYDSSYRVEPVDTLSEPDSMIGVTLH